MSRLRFGDAVVSAVDALRRSLEVPRVDVLAHVGAQTHWYRQRNPRLVDDGAMARFLASAGQAIRTDPRLMDIALVLKVGWSA